jgi:formylglycine-generating enzyme required for sulfatase activity
MDWDVFISHASEDKEDVASPLAEALRREGLRVWYDEFTLRVGDSLLHSIDHGLANSRYGIVILSPHFFAKQWTQKELAGLAAREVSGEKVILPVWHNITAEQVREYSPTLADRVAVSSDRGLEHVVGELLRVIRPTSEPVRPTVMERVQPFEPEMILIPGGEFLMGSDPRIDKLAQDNERPQHTLYLPDYYLAKTPVTNAQYVAFVQATGHRRRGGGHWEGGKPPTGKEDHPVVNITWHDAVAYCRWLAQVTGKSYRLPSEAEWEKGARGSDGRIYPWGNQWDAKRCNSQEGGKKGTTPVEAYPEGASPYGLLDMAGNVWEWTRSLWGEDWEKPSFKYPYDPANGRENPDATKHVNRVLRGGSFSHGRERVLCAYRLRTLPHHPWQGLRVLTGGVPRLGSPLDSEWSNE